MAVVTLPGVLLSGTFASRPAASAVAIGTLYATTDTGAIYQSDGASWSTWGSAALVNPMTTRGDLITRDASAAVRLAIGSAGKILSSDGTDASWGQGPLTTTGDLLIGATGGTPTRLAAGATAGHVLTSNGSGVAPSYQAAGGGGGAETGGYAIFPLDRTTDGGLDATFGDDFDEASLNARWTRVTQTSGEETYQEGPRASALRVTYNTGAASRYIYQTSPAGDWTFETCMLCWQGSISGQMFGIIALDTSGTGVAALLYDNSPGLILANITTGAYASALANPTYPVEIRASQRYWLRLRKASGVYYTSFSLSGETYSPEASGTPSAFTLARIGLGRFLGTNAADIIDYLWFDKTA